MRTLKTSDALDLEERIKLLLYAGLDFCVNADKDEHFWFSPLNSYCSEAFGVMQALEVLEYGYFGSVNVQNDRMRENEGINLKWWFEQLKEEVRKKGKELGPKEAYHWFKSLTDGN